MKYLVTGGCGFLGSNVSDYILSLGENLVIFDNLSRSGSEKNLEWLKSKGNFKFYQNDIRKIEDVELVIKNERPDVIFHFAGQVAMTTSISNPLLDFQINANGAVNLLTSVKSHIPNAIVCFSSTNKVYGDMESIEFKELKSRYSSNEFPNGFNESIPLDFHSPYGCSKGSADQYMLDFYRIFGIKTIVFRHSSIFGPQQFATIDQGWVGWFTQKAFEIKHGMLTEPFDIFGNGKQVRDILFANDLISCYFNAIEKINVTKGQAYNIGGGMQNSFSLLELFKYFESKLSVEMCYKTNPVRISDQKVFVADTSKAERDFNFKVTISKEEGIEKMYDWVEKINFGRG